MTKRENDSVLFIGGTVNPVKNYTLEFSSDMEDFETALKMAFGKFVTESSPEPSTKSTSPAASVVGGPPSLPPLTINGVTTPMLMNGGAGGPPSLVNGSPGALSTSMQSSFDGELVASLQGLTMSHSPTTPQVSCVKQMMKLFWPNI